ncbi:MAG: hypothetical protein FJ309_04070 [Planctomycetes bacterium]|nr:hypothetical protein [Planctomycetota bacterium]MBM4056796.1 hypothetical protein [Planctomycetota bacterium]
MTLTSADRLGQPRGRAGGPRFVVLMLSLLAVPAASAQWPQADPRQYVVAEALFLQKNNAAVDRSLVVDATAPDAPLLTAGDTQSVIGTGARLAYGEYAADGLGWEAGWLGAWGMDADSTIGSAAGTLQAAGELGFTSAGLSGGTLASVSTATQLNTAELNLLFHAYDGGYDRSSRYPWQRCDWYAGGQWDWIVGFRWAGLEDAATLGIVPAGAPAPSTYGVQASSNLFAGQIGARGRWNWQRWAADFTAKVGPAGTSLRQSQRFFDQLAPDDPFRTARASTDGDMGMIAEITMGGVWRITDVWGLRFGYDLLWLTGVALAADQFDLSANVDPQAGTAISTTGSVFFQGAHLGVEARW